MFLSQISVFIIVNSADLYLSEQTVQAIIKFHLLRFSLFVKVLVLCNRYPEWKRLNKTCMYESFIQRLTNQLA